MKKEIKAARLKKVIIRGYKSFSPDHPLEIELGDVNILLGANGSGKSNIISFFRMLNYMMGGGFQLFVEKEGTSQVFLHYGPRRTANICGELHFEDQTHINQYSFQLAYAVPDRLIITSEEVVWGQKNRTLQKLSLEPDFKESALINGQHSSNTTFRVIRSILSKCKAYQFHDSSPESAIRQSSPVGSANYLQAEGANLASFLYYLKENHRPNYDRIVGYIRLIMPQFRDFYLEPNEKGYVSLKWVDIFPNDYVLLPEQFSDGTIRFIALAVLLLQPEKTIPNVIIIDEPELGLHPFAISQLAGMIKEASRHAQVIVATQSPGLVDEFELHQLTILESDRERSYSTVHKLGKEELADWLKNYSLSELWDKNVIGGRP
jgi:predicted ATPase